MNKFRSWNENIKKFIYFEDGEYMYTDESGECEIHFDEDDINDIKKSINSEGEDERMLKMFHAFNWKNAEQEITRNGVTFFEGDKYKINDSIYGVIAIANGILGFKKYKTSSDEYIGFSKILEYLIQSMNKLGNIHENKEL